MANYIPRVKKLTAAPSETERPYPWQFKVGEVVYVKNMDYEETFQVMAGELWMGFPHYVLLDRSGKTWRIPQIHCSSKSLEPRKLRK